MYFITVSPPELDFFGLDSMKLSAREWHRKIGVTYGFFMQNKLCLYEIHVWNHPVHDLNRIFDTQW